LACLRLIARLDIKAPNLIKGVHFEGLRKLGDPQQFAERYYQNGIDELIYIDSVASLYERNTIVDLVSHTAEKIFIPITAGGGIRSVENARELLRAGADKVAINSAAIKDPSLIEKLAKTFGSQCVVVSIQAKRQTDYWECYYDNGREHSGIDVLDWVRQCEELGAGEFLVTSVDREGTKKGFDIDLISAVASIANVPTIASGGMGNCSHLTDVFDHTEATAAAFAHVLHYKELSVGDIRQHCLDRELNVRPF
jgi:cyclase